MPITLLSLLAAAALLALVPASAYLDRLIGSGEQGRTKPVLLSPVIFGAVGYAVFLHWFPAVIFGLSFAFWRTPGFGKNVIVPTTDSEKKATLLRHTIFSVPFLVAVAIIAAPIWYAAWVAACMIWFGIQAKDIAVWNAYQLSVQDGVDYNAIAEKKRGNSFGLAVAAAFIPFLVLSVATPLVDKTQPEAYFQLVKKLVTEKSPHSR